jgi:hypothetical protein
MSIFWVENGMFRGHSGRIKLLALRSKLRSSAACGQLRSWLDSKSKPIDTRLHTNEIYSPNAA